MSARRFVAETNRAHGSLALRARSLVHHRTLWPTHVCRDLPAPMSAATSRRETTVLMVRSPFGLAHWCTIASVSQPTVVADLPGTNERCRFVAETNRAHGSLALRARSLVHHRICGQPTFVAACRAPMSAAASRRETNRAHGSLALRARSRRSTLPIGRLAVTLPRGHAVNASCGRVHTRGAHRSSGFAPASGGPVDETSEGQDPLAMAGCRPLDPAIGAHQEALPFERRHLGGKWRQVESGATDQLLEGERIPPQCRKHRPPRADREARPVGATACATAAAGLLRDPPR